MNAPESIYISYSRNDAEYVIKLVDDLEKAGVRILSDLFDSLSSEYWKQEKKKEQYTAKLILIILSKYSVESELAMNEYNFALGSNKKIIFALISICDVPTQFRKQLIVDFTVGYRHGLNNLLGALGLRATVPLALQLIEENIITKSPRLDLSNCGMSEIPEEIGELEWLEELIIAGEIYYDYQQKSLQTTSNKGEQNDIITLPIGFKKLRKLRKIVLRGGKNRILLNDFSFLKSLTNLEYLDLSETGVYDLFPILRLKKLSYLCLASTPLKSILGLTNLTNLHQLDFSSTSVANISEVSQLVGLSDLRFPFTLVEDISAISNLKSLNNLIFTKTKVSDISPLSTLKNLWLVDFSGSPIKNFSTIVNLKSLQFLGFDNCGVVKLIDLAGLDNLKTFSCKGNPIADCPADVYETGDAKQLRAYFNAKKAEEDFNVIEIESDGLIENLKSEIDLRRDVKLIVLGNSNVGKTNLVNYLETGTFTGNRKTTHGLEVHRWLPDKERFGALGDIAVSIWDFGGQEYYHEAYRLFLSSNAVYLLLWCKESDANSRQPTTLNDNEPKQELEHFEITYWLDTIQHYSGIIGKPSGNPMPVTDSDAEVKKTYRARLIAVQNKVDDIEEDKKRIAQELHEKYKISDSFHISLLKGADAGNLQQNKRLVYFLSELESAILNNADIEMPPAKWQLIKRSILSLKSTKIEGETTGELKSNPFLERLGENPWINLEDFKEACKSLASELTDDEVYTLPRWLDKGGVVVYFPDIPELADKIFLRPDNLATDIYKILSEKIRSRGGEFSAEDLFSNDEKEKKAIFLELAKQLDLVFPHPDKSKSGFYLAPQYLPDNHPIEDLFKIASQGAWQSQIWIKIPLFYYKKILHGLLLHFASDAGTECKYFWKHGIMFVQEGLRVLIKGLYPDRLQPEGIILFGVEQDALKREIIQKKIFDQVLFLLAEKSDAVANPNSMGEMSSVPAPVTPDPKISRPSVDIKVSYDGENFISYGALLDNSDEPKVKAENSHVWLIAHNFSAILPSPPQKAKRVFLSYSHQNTKWLVRLRTHLAGIRRAKLIESWDDKEILPGDQWDANIKKNLEEADIFILLLSADFIASEYIWNEELRIAFRKLKERNAVIIPVLFEPLDLGGLSEISTPDNLSFKISDFEIIPKNLDGHLQAVSLWQNQEQALAFVAERIREAIQKR